VSRLSYYLDEDIDHGPTVAAGLRDRSIDAIAAQEAGRAGQGIPDHEQLEYASGQGRVMVTQDLRFAPHPPHSGLVVMQRKLSLSDYMLYLQIVAEQFSPGDLNNSAPCRRALSASHHALRPAVEPLRDGGDSQPS
jgi:hypothetical protein